MFSGAWRHRYSENPDLRSKRVWCLESVWGRELSGWRRTMSCLKDMKNIPGLKEKPHLQFCVNMFFLLPESPFVPQIPSSWRFTLRLYHFYDVPLAAWDPPGTICIVGNPQQGKWSACGINARQWVSITFIFFSLLCPHTFLAYVEKFC